MNEPQQSVGLQTPPAPAHGVRPVLPTPPAGPPPAKGRRGLWIWLLILLIAAGAGYYYWSHRQNSAQKAAASDTGSGRPGAGGRGQAGPIPVVAVKAQKGNIAVYFNGLGAVTPLATVTIKSRVDGQLMMVNYKEGDIVHQGDMLAESDPRPYQATLTQYEG